MNKAKKILTKTNFKKYLENAPANKRFVPESPCSCPIAFFFRDIAGLDARGVWVDDEIVAFGGYEAKTPNWARTFIGAFDSLAYAGIPVRPSPKKALEVLNSI